LKRDHDWDDEKLILEGIKTKLQREKRKQTTKGEEKTMI
jgi:heme exporter protein D